jgi:hypothetical protein
VKDAKNGLGMAQSMRLRQYGNIGKGSPRLFVRDAQPATTGNEAQRQSAIRQ